ncbi:30S ribosomal protein S8 [Candidatus Woesearchaeota archaeon]|nr:30S ribosomal protein S8 [Candidatus Woesearchaeota archaeon]
MLNNTLSNALSKVLNCQKAGKGSCEIMPTSKTIREVLRIMAENGYVGDVAEKKESRGSRFTVQLIGTINKCGAIMPRFPVKKGDFERFEKTYLPAKDFGLIIVSTQKGLMTHKEAKKQGIGGRLVSYCY